MKIRIIWVGRTKQRHTSDGIGLYFDKIRPFAEITVVEIKEQKGGPVELGLKREGERILKCSKSFVLFDERGRQMDSRGFASMLEGKARVDFVLGGAYGVSDAVRQAATDTVSLSRMTINHEMARLFALEQVYRAMMINTGRGYHH
jgi:23S rRNA (pseudouridine1915-N3)-methyltransferase